jgi:hypothetical protein
MYFSSFVIVLIVSLSLQHTEGKYTKFQYRDCGSSDVTIHTIAVEPMPLNYPGTMNITISSTLKRPIGK